MIVSHAIYAHTENITADQVEVGDTLVLPERVDTVSSVQTYDLASNDRVIATSTPSGRWPVVHILGAAGGIVRFPHETVTRLLPS